MTGPPSNSNVLTRYALSCNTHKKYDMTQFVSTIWRKAFAMSSVRLVPCWVDWCPLFLGFCQKPISRSWRMLQPNTIYVGSLPRSAHKIPIEIKANIGIQQRTLYREVLLNHVQMLYWHNVQQWCWRTLNLPVRRNLPPLINLNQQQSKFLVVSRYIMYCLVYLIKLLFWVSLVHLLQRLVAE